jgi:hypothetical protein
MKNMNEITDNVKVYMMLTDSIIDKCYKCEIKCLSPMPCVNDLKNAYIGMKDCGTDDNPDELNKCGNPSGYFEKC